jgi:CubicO group peptidase (beta-lactamase class C family)
MAREFWAAATLHQGGKVARNGISVRWSIALLAFLCLPGISLNSRSTQYPAQTDSVGATDARFNRLRSKIQELMLKGELPSVAVAVAQHGKIIWEQGFGWADREQHNAATADTMYSLASISKPFTATAIMTLVRQGKLKLDAPANDYLEAAKINGLAGDASGATVRRLLNHTSGMPLHWQFFYVNESYECPPMDDTILRYGNVINPPGEVYQYSNLGFGILSYVIARVSNLSYADAMRKLVFAPLGLPHSAVGITPGLKPYAAVRYDSRGRPIPFYTFDHPGASAIYSSAHDLIRFAMFHLKDHLTDQQPILDDDTIDLMHRFDIAMDGPKEFYALGFFGSPDEHGLKSIGHDGGMPGVSTIMRLYPDEDVAVVALTNASPPDVYSGIPVIPQIEQEIVASLVPRYAQALAANPTNPDSSKKTYTPSAKLLGTWTGTLRTWQNAIPFRLTFQPDGDIHVKLGDQFETLLNQPHWQGKMFVGLFNSSIPTPDGNRERHYVRLELWERGDAKLQGEANAEAADEPAHYSLASFVDLTRTSQ